ncbi:hypothetical protein GCM10017083_24610 [Thalassobaculum fulvum]|uniref:Lipoprotein n=1 Tax=Thalassobaculum fulvum TaxID=1633335 RepID=A0A919CPK4_9PROT|nr:hypothetical protein [Thalassobaculum fulvum]GHD50852.1 hypothetical protein GCM10017083_24610 [Thalassobaculum fulvum]
MRAAALGTLTAALLLAACGPAAAASVDGTWGVADGDTVACANVHVMVLRDGRYTKALLDLGTTEGPRDVVVGTSTYTFDGARLVVAPSMSLERPEPRQVFDWDPVGRILRRAEPAPRLTFRRCPDRPLRPLDR